MTTIKLHGCMLFYKGRDLLGDIQQKQLYLTYVYSPSKTEGIKAVYVTSRKKKKPTFQSKKVGGEKPTSSSFPSFLTFTYMEVLVCYFSFLVRKTTTTRPLDTQIQFRGKDKLSSRGSLNPRGPLCIREI